MLNVSIRAYSPDLVSKRQTKNYVSNSIDKNDQFLYNQSVNGALMNNIVFKGNPEKIIEKIDNNLFPALAHVFGEEFAQKPFSELSIRKVRRFIVDDLYKEEDLQSKNISNSPVTQQIANDLLIKFDLNNEYDRVRNALKNPPKWKYGIGASKESQLELKQKQYLYLFKETNSFLSTSELSVADFLYVNFCKNIYINLVLGELFQKENAAPGRGDLLKALEREKKALYNVFLLHSIRPSEQIQGGCHYNSVIDALTDTSNRLKVLNSKNYEDKTANIVEEVDHFLNNYLF